MGEGLSTATPGAQPVSSPAVMTGPPVGPFDPWAPALTAQRYGRAEQAPRVVLAPQMAPHVLVLRVRQGADVAFATQVRGTLGISVPPQGQWRACSGAYEGWRLAWDGPGAWRLVGQGAALGSADAAPRDADQRRKKLLATFADVAAGVDQSHGFALLHLSGAAACDVLARGTSLDVRATNFPSGSSAQTTLSHHPAALARLDDTPTFEIAIYTSMVGSLCDWLISAASPFGIEVRREPSAA